MTYCGLILTILLREFVKDPFQVLLDIFSFISLDAILNSVDAINCVAKVTPEVEYLIGSLIVPLFFTIGPILAHFNVVYMMRRAGKAKSFGLHLLWKTLGLFSLIFFISLCSSFLEPFRCNRHPSGLRTLQSSHGVLCGFTGTHRILCLIGGFLCLLPITYLALSCWIILVELPKRVRMADIAFIRACSFLVMRFHPGKETCWPKFFCMETCATDFLSWIMPLLCLVNSLCRKKSLHKWFLFFGD